ncbi:MAG: PAS domain S-box protein [Chloroflexi bacterium]|nr:PAS domain S-box protein [Chloroflexota bacterium]
MLAGFLHPDDLPEVTSALAEAVARTGSSPPVLARFRRADGAWRKLECVVNNLMTHPAVHGLVVNARDVTEREVVADALRDSEERYRLHFANINDVVYSYDAELRITAVSPGVERILGIPPETIIGASLLSLQDLEFVPPAYYEKALIEARKVLAGERVVNARYAFLARDGTTRIAEISSSPIYQDGRIIGVVNVARDVTERVQADERIRASLDEKEILLREIHHRVKNNLQIVSSLLNLQSASVEAPEIRTLFRDSQNRISSMALIHEQLYRSEDFARIDFGPYLRGLTRHLMQSYQAADNRIRLRVEVEDEIHLDIDTAIPCGLVTSELVSNALKHGFPDGASGTVGVEMRRLDDSQVELVVWDDGRGFSPEMAIRNSSSLGLQLIQRLTSQLGGRVEYVTTGGTRAVIRFRTARAAKHPDLRKLMPGMVDKHGTPLKSCTECIHRLSLQTRWV